MVATIAPNAASQSKRLAAWMEEEFFRPSILRLRFCFLLVPAKATPEIVQESRGEPQKGASGPVITVSYLNLLGFRDSNDEPEVHLK
ncbi:unnamed protein product [Mesocestoides corti]|uniref:Uncharacterized protein n=1 Tax=Mesocestoides corti TaxID=53468 RepID=A0A0R3UP43_MESCO|nr:unnamed protein product [Mesocestoides corti]